jgi:DNA-binding LytR/AlgR family response regulator
MYTCGIVEDEYLAQDILIRYINKYGNINVRWVFESIRDIHTVEKTDLLFLDLLDIPSNDFKTDESLNKVSEGISQFAQTFPKVVICTAYSAEYVKNIGIHHSRILMKPYTYAAFEEAMAAIL